MAIKRDSLRAQRDFYSPMTGNTGTEIRYAAAPTRQKDTYGSQVKEKLSDISAQKEEEMINDLSKQIIKLGRQTKSWKWR